jgi:hypothetical protein
VDVATNEGVFSDVWQFEVDTESPNAPVLTSPVGGVWLSDTSVTFQWSEVKFSDNDIGDKLGVNQDGTRSSPIRYILNVDTTTAFTSPLVIDTIEGTSTTKVLNEDFYYWRVKAYDIAGNQGPYANPDSFGIDITPPAIESTTVWTDTSFSGPFPVWTKIIDNVSGVNSVMLHYKRIEDPVWIGLTMEDSGNGWYYGEIPQVYVSNDTIKYYIYAVDIADNVSTDPENAPANFYSFISNMTGIAKISEIPIKFDLKVRTIAKGNVTFKLCIPDRSNVSLKIYDVAGSLIYEPISGVRSSGRYEISFKPLRKGIYFYRLESRYKNIIGKFIMF